MDSGQLSVLMGTALALGFLHTILGPDHYLPFAMMAKAQKWSRARTFWITLGCGLGHVGGSVLIGVVLAFSGFGISKWAGSRWVELQDVSGSLAAWLLMGLGASVLVWGLVHNLRSQKHSHPHVHEDGMLHQHLHRHARTHMHVHDSGPHKMVPWILFAVLIFGPCESLVPLMLAAWALSGFGGMALVALTFSVATLVTILIAVGLLQTGVSRISFGSMDRWSTVVAGFSLVICGVTVQWLGL